MSPDKINKQDLVALIISELKQTLHQAINAANETHAAAVDDESVAETQYDTLAIEAGYLAEGQSRRVQELQAAIQSYQSLSLLSFEQNQTISLSALVQLSQDKESKHWFFIGPAAGGFRCQLNEKNITVITPKSPMGLALVGKYQDDDVEVMVNKNTLQNYIERVL
jgi:transcription elongation GreA/GreB family factor